MLYIDEYAWVSYVYQDENDREIFSHNVVHLLMLYLLQIVIEVAYESVIAQVHMHIIYTVVTVILIRIYSYQIWDALISRRCLMNQHAINPIQKSAYYYSTQISI